MNTYVYLLFLIHNLFQTDLDVNNKKIILQLKHMLWVLKRTVSMSTQTYVKTNGILTLSNSQSVPDRSRCDIMFG